jgi:hypothetical protein
LSNASYALLISVFFVGLPSIGFSQLKKENTRNYFGFQYRPLIPVGVVGDRPFDMVGDGFVTTVSPVFGYSYGAIVRIGITELLAIETGMSRTRRNFRMDYAVPDSSLAASDNIGFINFDIPVNFVVYIKLGNKFYTTTNLGASLIYFPSNIQTRINPQGIHQFIFEGKRYSFFSSDINANIGFEYRTEDKGVFYIGLTGKVPLSPAMRVASEYRYDTNKNVAFSDIQGASVSLDFRYFLNHKPPRGNQTKKGPIVQ